MMKPLPSCPTLTRLAPLLLLLPMLGCGLSRWAHNGLRIGPNYKRPTAAFNEAWSETDSSDVEATPPDWDWWTALDDPILNGLIQQASDQNLPLREAGWRVMQARAIRAIAVGNIFPQTQELLGSYDRVRASRNIADPIDVTAFDNWATALNVSWELDVWGKYRRAVASSDAQLSASVAEFDGVLLSLIAEVAIAYTDIRTFQLRLQFAKRNAESQAGSVELARTQADEGKTNYVSVYQSKSNLDSTEATIPALETGLRQANNRLCTLLGMPTRDMTEELGEALNLPSPPTEIAVGIPADLLRRRPDIRFAERELATQGEQIGIALTDLYPSLRINGDIGFASENISNLFSSGSFDGIIGPSFRWKILNYGRIRNNVVLQRTHFEELTTAYRNTVLRANQEVEDALIAFQKNQERVLALRGSAEATEKALELELVRFTEGETDFNGVFVLQGDLTLKQDALVVAQGEVLTSLITLYKALGGGWQLRCQPVSLVAEGPHVQVEESLRLPDLIED